jgi:hypothetical protein
MTMLPDTVRLLALVNNPFAGAIAKKPTTFPRALVGRGCYIFLTWLVLLLCFPVIDIDLTILLEKKCYNIRFA